MTDNIAILDGYTEEVHMAVTPHLITMVSPTTHTKERNTTMNYEQITIFISESSAKKAAMKHIETLRAGAYRITPATVRCADKTIDKGFKVLILKPDLEPHFYL